MGEWGGLIYLVLPILLLLLILSRSRKQQRQVLAVQEQVGTGAQVMMTSGVFGEVVAVADDGDIVVESAPGVHTRWTRRAVAQVIEPHAAGDELPVTDDPPPAPPATGSEPPYSSG